MEEVGTSHDLAIWLLLKPQKMPRYYHFTLGQQGTKMTIDGVAAPVNAAYSHDKWPERARPASRWHAAA